MFLHPRIQAIYLYVENLRNIIRKALSQSEPSAPKDTVVHIPNLNWTAERGVVGKDKSEKWWAIYDENRKSVGTIFDDGRIYFEGKDKEITHEPSVANKPIQAAKFMYLKSLKPREVGSITEGRRIDFEAPHHYRTVKSSDMKGWEAHIIDPNYAAMYDSVAYVYDNKGDYVGCVTYTGGYKIVGSHKEFDPGKFNPKDDNSIIQAMRYLYFKTQKPKNSTPVLKESAEPHKAYKLRGTDYWANKGSTYNGYTIWEKGHRVGEFYTFKGESVLYYNDPVRSTVHAHDNVVKDFKGDIKQALKYVYLHRMEPTV